MLMVTTAGRKAKTGKEDDATIRESPDVHVLEDFRGRRTTTSTRTSPQFRSLGLKSRRSSVLPWSLMVTASRRDSDSSQARSAWVWSLDISRREDSPTGLRGGMTPSRW